MAEAIILTQGLVKQIPSLEPGSNTAESAMLEILSGINLTINKAETVAIVGASGSGKSTLLGLLAGLDVATSGNIELGGKNLSQLDEDQRAAIRAEHVGFVFQSFQLLPNLSALENVMLPLELKAVTDAESRAKKLLQRVGLGERLHHYPKQLSGGEQQRVAIARAFVTEPSILFADEPTGNLDKATGDSVIELLFEVNREHRTTLIIVTHDERLAEQCQRTLVLENGLLIEAGVA